MKNLWLLFAAAFIGCSTYAPDPLSKRSNEKGFVPLPYATTGIRAGTLIWWKDFTFEAAEKVVSAEALARMTNTPISLPEFEKQSGFNARVGITLPGALSEDIAKKASQASAEAVRKSAQFLKWGELSVTTVNLRTLSTWILESLSDGDSSPITDSGIQNLLPKTYKAEFVYKAVTTSGLEFSLNRDFTAKLAALGNLLSTFDGSVQYQVTSSQHLRIVSPMAVAVDTVMLVGIQPPIDLTQGRLGGEREYAFKWKFKKSGNEETVTVQNPKARTSNDILLRIESDDDEVTRLTVHEVIFDGKKLDKKYYKSKLIPLGRFPPGKYACRAKVDGWRSGSGTFDAINGWPGIFKGEVDVEIEIEESTKRVDLGIYPDEPRLVTAKARSSDYRDD